MMRDPQDDQVDDDERPQPCTCTLACIPAGLEPDQFCREVWEAETGSPEPGGQL